MTPQDDLSIRPAREEDLPEILQLLQASLGWVPNEQYAAFFAWKHHDNPFGRSPAWVATDGERIVGLRTWLQWAFAGDHRRFRAVRAVDTATHPDHQGRGIFTRLTRHSLEALRSDNVDFVFNTPNEQSRPGYLKMGWQEVGTLPVAVRPSGPQALARMARARVPADKWSQPCDGGLPAPEVLADTARVQRLLDQRRPDGRLRTDLTPAVLAWRYGFAPLHYRAVTSDDGIAVFRVRRRGEASECVIDQVLAGDRGGAGRLERRAAAASGADYALRIGGPLLRGGFLPLPGQGPILTWREITEPVMPPLGSWDLTMGDIELF